ncbi:MAG TPA: YncE family protein [Planctomycetes bacterium]|nr:YncE family protein [Planctomycetota bacterium]
MKMNMTSRSFSRSFSKATGSLVALSLLFVAASCGGGAPGGPGNQGPFEVTLVSTGLGQLYPYRIAQLDEFKQPTTKIVNITSESVLKENQTSVNKVLPVATWESSARLPNGSAGNQFLLLRFSHYLKIDSILSDRAADQINSGLTGSIQVVAYDPTTETQQIVKGRAFINGKTYLDNLATPGFDLTLTKAVEVKNGVNTVVDSRASGFPSGFDNETDLLGKDSFVFIPDADGDLDTFETFPTGKIIRVEITSAVLDIRGKPLTKEVLTASVVGTDTIVPQVLGFTKVSANQVSITPGNGVKGVDPLTTIEVSFSKPMNPRDIGAFFSTMDKTPRTGSISLSLSINSVNAPVLYYADPKSSGDLTTYVIRPAFQLLGKTLTTVTVNNTCHDLAGQLLGTTVTTNFTTGDGPGLVNAPVAPEAIYVGRASGDQVGVSVIDMNGAGQGTGDITNSNWPRNPNRGQPGVFPALQPGKTNLDAGGEGALTLTRTSTLSTLLLDKNIVSQVGDIQIGQPLDKLFNNENINSNVSRTNQVNPVTLSTQNAWGNSITVAPHPNPPKLLIPPPNPAYGIFGEEPTMTTSTDFAGQIPGMNTIVHPPVGPCPRSPINRLTKGDPLTTDPAKFGIFGGYYNGVFVGPIPPPGSPQPPTPFCPYTSRQQIGHFLYVLDRGKKQVLVVNSNRFTVLETIKLSDPYSMAMAPNLKRLAVTNFSSGTVDFIDIDPSSLTFHQIISEAKVGRGPTGIAWQPEGEDVLVVNSLDDSMSIIGGADLKVRKTILRGINKPIEVAVTPRQVNLGWQTGIYFAYILNGDGTVAVFESGPDGINGIGFDNVIGVPNDAKFRGATTIQPDILSANSAVWVANTDANGFGVVTHLELTASPLGPLPIDASQGGFILPPTFRQRVWTVNGVLGGAKADATNRLSGNDPVDIALDDIYNVGALPDLRSTFISNLTYADHSGKGMLKAGNTIASLPRYLLVALGDVGKVDVVELDTGLVLARIAAPGVTSLCHYWRQ